MRHIEIVAAFGTGKSSLAKVIARKTGFEFVEEEHENHPIEDRFNKNPLEHALEYGAIVSQWHAGVIKDKLSPPKLQILDFSPIMDKAMALTYKAFGAFQKQPGTGELYLATCDKLFEELPKPALRVYLPISPEEHQKRIRNRGRDQDIAPDPAEQLMFLQVLKQHIDQVIPSIDDGVPMMTIDAEKYDWVNNMAHQKDLTSQVMDTFSIALKAVTPKNTFSPTP